VDVQRLEDEDEDGLRALLLADPATNLFLLSYLDGFGLTEHLWLGIRQAGALRAAALCLDQRLTVPWAPSPEHARAVGRALRGLRAPTMMVGPRASVDALWGAWSNDTPVDRWYNQRLYTFERPGGARHAPAPLPEGCTFRLGREDEEELVTALSAAMEAEDLGRHPLQQEPQQFKETVRRRLRTGATWVIERQGEIVFQIHTGARTPWGIQVGGTYVPPQHRGEGLGAVGMRAVALELHAQFPRVTLHVNEANTPAVRTYEQAGFQPHSALRLLTLAAA
jgi:GNAT superfamily N-acetyltransferase